MVEIEPQGSSSWHPSPEDLKAIAAATEKINGLLRLTNQNIIEIGRELNAIRPLIPKRKWQRWLKDEFGMSQPTAYRFMRIAKEFGDVGDDIAFPGNSIDRIDRHALFLLTDPNVSRAIRFEVVARANAGERISKETMREMLGRSLPRSPVIENSANIVPLPEPEDEPPPPPPAGLVPIATLLHGMELTQRASKARKLADEVLQALNNAQLGEVLAVIIERAIGVAEAWREVALSAQKLSVKKGVHLSVINNDEEINDE
jgi:hypothetical protein